ncbi:alpha/beta fold hydrolase [Intrasporangium flavum]|uniref:alpha/beta fold hydrolase n=1 Tax=Intrasporangium flavum TaxID=1428657 RepID=UPI00096C2083|nr:alpha/beta hydrolase [Intrasporangium flavum]
MPTYTSYDGTQLAYHVEGDGEPLVVWPGGPARDAAYLGTLGGLAGASGRALVVPDPRGTGASPRPDDPATYAAPRLADDLEALREHLGLTTVDLLGHSAGGFVAQLYAAAHPERVGRLVLVTPASSIEVTDEEWAARVQLRAAEPWFAEASLALAAEEPTPATRRAMSPFLYGAWTDAAREHAESDASQHNRDGTAAFWSGVPDDALGRDAFAALEAPVRIVVGELDLVPGPEVGQRIAALFADGRCIVQDGAGHFPWVDDPALFAALVTEALTD